MVLTAFVGLTAVGGGIALATGAEGDRFPVAWLDGTPFGSYLIPGLILAIVVGGSSVAALIAVWRSSRLAGAATVLAAITLTGQIVGEIALLGQPEKPTVTEYVYLCVAFVMALSGTVALSRARTSLQRFTEAGGLQRFTETGGFEPFTVVDGLAVYRIGNGEPVLLMPGPHRFQIPGDGSAGPLIEGLRGLGRQVISFDPPGSGRSSRPARVGMAEMHDCADEALAACGVELPVDAVGHSMGGLAVLAYAIERPARVRRLVLIGTGWGGPAYMKAPGALWNRTHPRFWRMVLLSMGLIAWPRLATERAFNNFVKRESFVDRRHARVEPVGLADWFRPRHGRADWHRVAVKLDYSSRLSTIGAPTLVLCGQHDPQYPISSSRRLCSDIPHARLSTFEHSGHYPFIEEPGAFWSSVAEFLAGSTAGGAGRR